MLCPAPSQCVHRRWPLRRIFFFFTGFKVRQVRVLCPTVPQALQTRRPSLRGVGSRFLLRAAPAGLICGQVRALWFLLPQFVQERVNRFLPREIRRSADSGLMLEHVLTLCPNWPQEAHTRRPFTTQSQPLFDL
jgi:hypothetical protein